MGIITKTVRSLVPAEARPDFDRFVDSFHRSRRRGRFAGTAFHCPCCDSHVREFRTMGLVPRPNAQCPVCDSLERHRLMILFLRSRTNLFRQPQRLLHFAPEPCLKALFSRTDGLDYVTADLTSPNASIHTDITDIVFRDNTFDSIICSHVLEHIPDDARAMRELLRVLRPGGWALLQVPLNTGSATTYEDFSITEPAAREKAFGQHDHVRVYGCDYESRLRAAGFQVDVERFWETLPEETRTRSNLPQEDMYLCRKPVA